VRAGVLTRDDGLVVARLEIAQSARERMRGLLGRPGLQAGHGLLLPACSSVHTFFMRFDLCLVFLSRKDCVKRIVWRVPPWRIVLGGAGVASIVEFAGGWLQPGALAVGQAVAIVEES